MTILANATNSPTAATVALIQAEKPAAKHLGMAKHPLPTEMFIFMGRKLIFAYPISHLCLLGFTFMFLNINTLYRFGIYSSLMTGNIIDVVLDILAGEYKVVLFKLTIIFVHAFGGTSLNCYLMEYTKSRENTFALIMLGLIITCVLVDLMYMHSSTDNHYVVALLCIVTGALAHWGNKLGYTLMLHTGNVFKLSETAFLFLNGYAVGGAKARGDAVLLIFLILSSLFGAFLAVMALVYAPRASLIPVLATIPLHMHLSGTLAMWGYPILSVTDYMFGRHDKPGHAGDSNKANTANSSANNSNNNSGAASPVRNTLTGRTTLGAVRERDTNDTNFADAIEGGSFGSAVDSARNTAAARPTVAAGRTGAFSVFERVEISPEELRAFEALMNERSNRLNSTIG